MEPRLFQVHTEALLQEWQQIVAAEKYDFDVCVPSIVSWFEVVPCSMSRGDCVGDSCPICQGWLELQLYGESGWVPRWLVFGHEFNDGSSTSTHRTSSSSLSRPPPALPSRPPVALHDHEVVELAGYFNHTFRMILKLNLVETEVLQVSSCKNTSSAFSVIENIGDNVLSEHGPRIVSSYLRDQVSQLSDVDDDDLLALASDLSPALHANVMLGPFLSELLSLHSIFSMDLYAPEMNPEVSAAMFEALIGIVFRLGLDSLFRAVVGFGLSIALSIACYIRRGVTVYDALCRINTPSYASCRRYNSRLDFTIKNPYWKCLCCSITEGTVAQLQQRLFKDLFLIQRGSSFVAEPRPLKVRRSRRELHPDGNLWRWCLVCIEHSCKEEFISNYYEGDEGLEEAKKEGWTRASKKTWRKTSRCKLHPIRW